MLNATIIIRTLSRLTQCQRQTEVRLLFRRYLKVRLNSRIRQDLWNVMGTLAKCQYPFYFRMYDHLEEIRNILPQFAGFNISHFMLQVFLWSVLYTGTLDFERRMSAILTGPTTSEFLIKISPLCC
jgi:hypothetical protein